MLDNLKIENVFFLDIETVPVCKTYNDLSDQFKILWDKKAQLIAKDGQTPVDVYPRAGIYAEFGKIICVSIGMLQPTGGVYSLKVKSVALDDEKQLLTEFINILNKALSRSEIILCAHNGKEFDFPYLARRILINGLKLPSVLDTAGKKPWETHFLDTLDLWKFGDYKSFTSLELLSTIFNIPSPKNDIDGSQVYKVYYEDRDLERIASYCQNDVIALTRLLLKWKGLGELPDSKIFQ